LNHDDEENCRWADRKLRIGDQVEIKIVEVPRVDAPAKREAAQMTRAKHLRMQKQMVRRWAKELGWIIQTRPIKRKSVTRG
jgi:predicted alpha/beta-hydrolase family hydrolase